MKNVFRWLVVVLLIVTAVVVPAAAQTPTELNALAEHFPAETPVFVSLRTDDGYIDALDGLLARIEAAAAALPGAEPITGLREGLNEATSQLFNGEGDFDSRVRSWLGDTMSIGILSLDNLIDSSRENDDAPILRIALVVTDRAAAETFWDTALNSSGQDVATSMASGFTVYTTDDAIVSVGDEVAFVTTILDSAPLSGQDNPLSADASFQALLAALPAPQYNINAYVNLGDTFAELLSSPQLSQRDREQFEAFGPLFASLPAQIIGATILDGRSLTLDVVQPLSAAMEMMEQMGLEMPMLGPVDPAFAARVPAGTPLFIHSTNLQASYTQFQASLAFQRRLLEDSTAPGMAMQLEQFEQIDQALQMLTTAIQDATGLNFEKEILPALTGDYALFLKLTDTAVTAESPFGFLAALPVSGGFVTAVSDPAVAQGIIDGIETTITSAAAEGVEVSRERAEGRDVLNITILATRDLPFPIRLAAAAADGVLYIGTADIVGSVLNPDGGLPTDAQYQEAGAYLVPDAVTVAYLGSDGLAPLSLLAAFGSTGDAAQQGVAAIQAVFGLFNSMSVSANYAGDYSYGRAVITLAP